MKINVKIRDFDVVYTLIALLLVLVVMCGIMAHQRAEITALEHRNATQAEQIKRQREYINDFETTDWEHEIEVMNKATED